VLRVRYDALLADPAKEVDRMTEFLGLQVRLAQKEHAVELVRPRVQTISHNSASPMQASLS